MPHDRDPAEGFDPFPADAAPIPVDVQAEEVIEYTPAESAVLDIAGKLMSRAALASSESIMYARQAAQLETFVRMLDDETLEQIAEAAKAAHPSIFGN
jgi:hypothetical protein